MTGGAELRLRLHGKSHDGRAVLGATDLHVAPGERLVLWGRSGCGKTTLLHILAGLDVQFDGALDTSAARPAMVFQNPALLPWRSVRDNIVLAAPEIDDPLPLLEALELDDRIDDFPGRLSLGMQRRVAAARALAAAPDLLLLDEPFASLDQRSADLLHALLNDYAGTMVLAAHNLDDCRRLCRRMAKLDGEPARITVLDDF